MNWYYETLGAHTHVRVFMNGAKCGELCFRNEEFELVKADLGEYVEFTEEKLEIQKNLYDYTD